MSDVGYCHLQFAALIYERHWRRARLLLSAP